jgi:hypothetical protein
MTKTSSNPSVTSVRCLFMTWLSSLDKNERSTEWKSGNDRRPIRDRFPLCDGWGQRLKFEDHYLQVTSADDLQFQSPWERNHLAANVRSLAVRSSFIHCLLVKKMKLTPGESLAVQDRRDRERERGALWVPCRTCVTWFPDTQKIWNALLWNTMPILHSGFDDIFKN